MNIRFRTVLALGVCVLCATAAWADWDPGQPHKMHFPQLPDPAGWDVNATYPKVLADDWRCSQTGPVTDIHLWVSSQGYDGRPNFQQMRLSIHDNDPGPPSKPRNLLWERIFTIADPIVKIRQYGTGPQGWFDPNTGFWRRPDHEVFYQVNVVGIPQPFVQKLGEIYWLDASFYVPPGVPRVGWKTSRNHFMDDAVWGDLPSPQWKELRDPITQESLDLAFVITPEPQALLLLTLGGLILARRPAR